MTEGKPRVLSLSDAEVGLLAGMYLETLDLLGRDENGEKSIFALCAKLAAGWGDWRSRFHSGFGAAVRAAPWISGKVDPTSWARQAWVDAHHSVRMWSLREVGVELTPRQVLDEVEIVAASPDLFIDPARDDQWEHVPLPPSMDVDKPADLSLAPVKGTQHDIIEHVVKDPASRAAAHRILAEDEDADRRTNNYRKADPRG